MAVPEATFIEIAKAMPLPKEACDEEREQYRSDIILNRIRVLADKARNFDHILAILDVDIYVPPLSFVFGEAENPGKAALISLYRLRPEFYKQKMNEVLFYERITKEAVHELGHTLGLKHCLNPFCVMYFSNSIFETDRKQSLFCNRCYALTQETKNTVTDDADEPQS